MTGASKADRGPLGGIHRRPLIRALALSGRSQSDLAEEYGVTQGAISQFASRNAAEIQAVREDSANEFAGILIVDKANRLATYQQLLHEAMKPVPKTDRTGNVVRDPETGDPVLEVDVRAAQAVLKSVAEEMGHLLSRQQISGDVNTTTTYKIVGVDDTDLT